MLTVNIDNNVITFQISEGKIQIIPILEEKK